MIALLLAAPLRAETSAPFNATPYFDNRAVDLTQLLPPPPAADSLETKTELGELLVMQLTRTPEMVSRAQADAIELRPHMVSDLIKPVVRLSDSGSWPAPHAALGTLMGIVLGSMIPEKRAAIMDRARVYGDNRMVAGIHFPSDVEMGRIAGTAIAAVVMRQPQFTSDYQAARRELRTALGR